MTEKETKPVMAHSLYDMGQQLNALFAEGYTIKGGWPLQIGWMYDLQMEKDVPSYTAEVVKKQSVGRPKAA